MSSLTKSKKVEFCTSFFTYDVTVHVFVLKTDKYAINWHIFLLIIHENSNELYPSMVARYKMILESSIIMH